MFGKRLSTNPNATMTPEPVKLPKAPEAKARKIEIAGE